MFSDVEFSLANDRGFRSCDLTTGICSDDIFTFPRKTKLARYDCGGDETLFIDL